MKIICIIPSRIGSTRLPRKPLLPLKGKTMIEHVYENAKACPLFTDVIVATDSEEIVSVIKNIGGNTFCSKEEFITGSDRVAAVAAHYPHAEIIVNLQGDEPFVTKDMLTTLLTPYLQNENPDMATLANPLDFATEYDTPNIVKVITNLKQYAIYFSRAPIPYFRCKGAAPVYHHIGLYAFRRDFLLKFPTLAQTPLELAESLEQLRALEHGFNIKVSLTTKRTLEINTREEYELAQSYLANVKVTT